VSAGYLGVDIHLAPLVAGLAPALAGMVLATAGPGGRLASIVFWSLGTTVAALASGGVSGPLAPWCLAPLAAAAAFRDPKLLPFAAAASIAGGAVEVLSTLLLPLPALPAAASPWLSLLSLGGAATGLGAALVALQAQVAAERATGQESYAELLELLEARRARENELEALREAAEQQNQAKSRFLANMSHELRTPLNAIMGFSDIMRQRLFGPLSDRYADYAELVHESGAHLLELINDVLDMSKIEAARFELAREMFDAREAFTAALRLMRGQADRAGISLRGVLPTEPLEADADRRALKQIAINLLANALKFTPRGGSVTLTLQAAGDQLELVVADTGVGISREDLERLGRPFEQAGDAVQKAGGSGLGLSLVRAFAQLHGGEMVVESVLGEGTTVIVRLPVLVPPQAQAAAPVAARA
jgi:signal transduction histidine kinase